MHASWRMSTNFFVLSHLRFAKWSKVASVIDENILTTEQHLQIWPLSLKDPILPFHALSCAYRELEEIVNQSPASFVQLSILSQLIEYHWQQELGATRALLSVFCILWRWRSSVDGSKYRRTGRDRWKRKGGRKDNIEDVW